MQPRRIARELALLTIGQLPTKPERLAEQELQDLMLSAVRTLMGEVQETLETATAELKRGNDRLFESEVGTLDLQSARAMVAEAIELTQAAVNRLGIAVELPEFIYLTNQEQVRSYALTLVKTVHQHRAEIDQLLSASLVDWQLHRLAHIDRNLLRIAVAEMTFLELPRRVAINEAVELAKRYSSEDSHRFLNGVLRRVTQQLKETVAES
jgi:N utilization substance protein B